MKGDLNPSLPNLIQQQSTTMSGITHPVVFRRNRSERLDWRKIASLDTEKLIQESDVETLQEILPEIAFCKAEVEFDHEKTDPGFRKVFQLSQLIIEYLLYNQTLTTEKSTTNEQRCTELAEENKKCLDDVKSLKDKLADAKKELKNRKQMLVSSQNELMGANKDEYDQCPYCTKKFIASVYLFSHMQRRHQGLPLHPMFGAQPQTAHSLMDFRTQYQIPIPNRGFQDRSDYKIKSSHTQTSDSLPVPVKTKGKDESSEINSSADNSEKVNVNTVSGIVEKYLQQKSSAGEALDNLLPSPRVRGPSGSTSLASRRQSLEESERNIIKIKEELESQWKSLAEKIHQTGVQELKSVLMTEMQKMQEIITATAANAQVRPVQRELPEIETSSATIIGKVEERFLQQESELQVLRENLQNKMEGDLVSIEGKLESQERFWRSKLRQVEEEYHQQVSKLRHDFQESICHLPSAPHVPHQFEKANTSLESNVKSPSGSLPSGSLPPSRTPSPALSKGESVQVNIESPSKAEFTQVNIVAHKPPIPPEKSRVSSPRKRTEKSEIKDRVVTPPVPKPRTTKKVSAHYPSETLTPMVKAALNKINATPAPAPPSPTPVSALHHEYEEPDDIRKSDEVSDYSSSEVSTPSEETRLKIRKEKGILKQHTTPDVNDKLSQMRKKVLTDVNKQMKELGLNPDGSPVEINETKKALARVRRRRRKRDKVDPKFKEERQLVKESVKFSAIADSIKPDLVHPTLVKPKKPGAVSPLVKMFSAVKSQGSSWKKKVTTSLAKRKSAQRPVESPNKSNLKTFFTRASARLKKTPQKTETNMEAEESDNESDTSSSSSSQQPNMPMLTRSKPILVNDNKNKRERESSKERRKEKALSEHSSEVESDSEPEIPKPPVKFSNSRTTVSSVRNVRMPQILGKRPVERDLLKDFEAVAPTAQKNKGKEESKDVLNTSTSRDVSGDSSFVSGTGTPETSDSDSLSLAFKERNNQDDGHYVSLRPPTVVENIHNVNDSGNELGISGKSNNLRRATTVPGNNTNSSTIRGRLSPRKPEVPSVFTVSPQVRPNTSPNGNAKTSDWNSSSDDDRIVSNPQFKSTQMYPTSSQPSLIQKHGQTSSVTSKSSPRPRVWTSTPRESSSVQNKLASKPKQSAMDNSWDSDID